MDSLEAAIDRVGAERKSLEVFTADEEVAAELAGQFSTRNVDVNHRPLPSGVDRGFEIVRDEDGTFRGALGINALDAIVSPETHPPWVLADSPVEPTDVFDFLENTLFTSYDRRQMLAAAREIEERAWRIATGELFVGFQRAATFDDQRPVYGRFEDETDVAVTLFVADEWDVAPAPVPVVTDGDGELGRYWFVLFDGGGNAIDACGLLAEERESGTFFGFWTDHAELVDEVVAYLRETYVDR